MVLLPSPMRLAVPAYWTLEPKFDPHWQGVLEVGSAVSIVVVEQSWPETAKNDAGWRSQAQSRLGALPGAVLGYVYTRDANGAVWT
jgi:hypothetical protein